MWIVAQTTFAIPRKLTMVKGEKKQVDRKTGEMLIRAGYALPTRGETRHTATDKVAEKRDKAIKE